MNESEPIARISDTVNYHLYEKRATMDDEPSAATMFRGIYFPQVDLFENDIFGYPDSLGKALVRFAQDVPQNAIILNVGDGLGDNSAGIRDAFQSRGIQAHYINGDLSPALLQVQRAKNPHFHHVQLNMLQFPFSKDSIHGAVFNECIGDLPVIVVPEAELMYILSTLPKLVPFQQREMPEDAIEAVVRAFDRRFGNHEQAAIYRSLIRDIYTYGLSVPQGFRIDENPELVFNTGAISMLEKLYEALEPGGWAWISEHGTNDWLMWPSPVIVGGHVEYSIKFDDLERVAGRIGFDPGETATIDLSRELKFEKGKLVVAVDSQIHGLHLLSVEESMRLGIVDADHFLMPYHDRNTHMTSEEVSRLDISPDTRRRIITFEEWKTQRQDEHVAFPGIPIYSLDGVLQNAYVLKLRKPV